MDSIRVLAIVTGLALTVAPLAAQAGGSKAGSTSTGTSTTTTTTTPSTGGTTTVPGGIGSTSGGIPSTGSIPSSTSPNTFPNDSNQGPIYLSGRVMLNDGTVPAGQVVIERVCNDRRDAGRAIPEGYTDPKGYFSFQLGQNRGMFFDASEPMSGARTSAGLGLPSTSGSQQSSTANNWSTCDLRASLAGYHSDTISLATHRYMDNPDVGTIILHRMANVEGLTTSATSAMASKDARKAYEKGLDDVKKKKLDDAQRDFEKAVSLHPKYAAAWFELGRVFEQREQFKDARDRYAASISADSKYINPYERLYLLDLREQKWQEVADTSEKVMRLNPFDFPGAFYVNALANLQLGKVDVAEHSAREAVKLDTAHRNPRAGYLLGIALAQQQNFTESAKFLRAYLEASPDAPDAPTVRKQLAEAEKSSQAKNAPVQTPN